MGGRNTPLDVAIARQEGKLQQLGTALCFTAKTFCFGTVWASVSWRRCVTAQAVLHQADEVIAAL